MTNYKWLLKRVRCVSVRNLSPTDGKDLENLPSPELEIFALDGDDSNKLRGPVISETCNPDWYVSDLQRGAKKVNEACSKAMLRVKNSVDGQVLLESELSLDSLKFLGPSFNIELFQKLPFNTVFFITDAGFFVQSETFDSLNRLLTIPLDGNEASSDSDNDESSPKGNASLVDESSVSAMAKLLKEIGEEKEGKEKDKGNDSKDDQILENKRKTLQIAQLLDEIELAEYTAGEEEKAEAEDLAVLKDTGDLQAHIERCSALATQIGAGECKI